MFSLTEQHRYFLYRGVADMRKGFDGLGGLVKNEMQSDPVDGSVYMFINRRRDRLKILVWQCGGFVLYYKRLEQGTFDVPLSSSGFTKISISWEQLVFMIRGIKMEKIERKKRYKMR